MTMRNLMAAGLFLFGTTFLWLTPAIAGRQGHPPSGPRWAAVQLLAWVTIAGFTVASWALLRSLGWWPLVLSGAAVLGVAVTLLFGVAARGAEGVANVAGNVGLHAVVSLVVLAAMVVPTLREALIHRL